MKKNKHGQTTMIPMNSTPFTSRRYLKEPISVNLVHPHAQLPERAHDTDVGLDVTLVERCDGKTEDTSGEVTRFDTGLRIKAPEGYHVEVVARSSLHKEGYELVNGVGIIDPDYRGNVMVALKKFGTGDDLKLPGRYVQFVLRKTYYAYAGLVEDAFEDTERGEGGFGSSNRRGRGRDDDEDSGKGKEKLEIPRRRTDRPNASKRTAGGSFYN